MTTFLFEEIKTIREYAPEAYKELPKYVVHNLTQKYQIRPYQEQAFRNFITYFENDRLRHRPSQVLFHMATGSGKTLSIRDTCDCNVLTSLEYPSSLNFLNG